MELGLILGIFAGRAYMPSDADSALSQVGLAFAELL